MVIECPDLTELVLVMISMAPNSGWVERGYSYLERVCEKRRNRLNIENLRELFFLALLKLPVKDCMDYVVETDLLASKKQDKK